MNYSISMFIDNELGLDEKTEFVKKTHNKKEFYDETLALLEQEKLMRSDPISGSLPVRFKEKKRWLGLSIFRSFGLLASAGAVATVILMFIFSFQEESIATIPHRFLIYKPGVNKVEISGSFTGWKVLPLKKIGASGYWEIELAIPQGEHRYAYILEQGERVPDPTILTREKDDFGGENSILFVEA